MGAGNSISILACLAMLVKACCLPRNLRCRPMPRLMILLALSDIVFHAYSVWSSLNGMRCPYNYYVCLIWPLSLSLSIWLELAISVAFWAQSSRRVRRLLPHLPWVAMICVAGTTVAESFSRRTMVSGLSMWFTCALSSTCFITAALKAKQCTDVVEKRCWIRSLSFAANALFTELPFAVYDAIHSDPHHWDAQQSWPNAIPFMLLSLSGFANCCTFFWQSRYSNGDLTLLLKDAAPAEESFNVKFEAGDAQTIP